MDELWTALMILALTMVSLVFFVFLVEWVQDKLP